MAQDLHSLSTEIIKMLPSARVYFQILGCYFLMILVRKCNYLRVLFVYNPMFCFKKFYLFYYMFILYFFISMLFKSLVVIEMMWKKYYYYSIIAYHAFIVIYIFKILIFENGSILFKGFETFLSTWVVIIQGIYFLTMSGYNLMMLQKKKQSTIMERCLSLMLTTVLFPLTIYASVTFWILYTWEVKILPSINFDRVVPALLNHICHTNVVLLAVIECIIKPHKYPSRKIGLGVLYFILSSYTIWIHVMYFQNHRWVYPFLDNLNFQLRMLFFIYSAVIAYCLYVFGEKLNWIIWSKSKKS